MAPAALSALGPPLGLPGTLPTRSALFRHALAQLERYAPHDDATILLEGESGTGKTLLARYIHAQSARARGPLREVALGALDDALAGSDLFGHVEGAFTDARRSRAGHFQLAHRGTLFLDETGKASLAVQKKLLRVTETGEIWPVGADRPLRVDVRIIAAADRPLAQLVAEEKFFPDLYARLASFRVELPPLRERREDIPALVAHFVAAHARCCGYGDRPPEVDGALMRALTRAEWPYNVRELDSAVHRLLVDAQGAEVLTVEHCVGDLEYLWGLAGNPGADLTPERVDHAVREYASVAKAARALGVARSTIYRYLSRRPGGHLRDACADGVRPTA